MAQAVAERRKPGWALRVAAAELLARERIRGAIVHRVERQLEGIFWAAYERNGSARTAIIAGEKPKNWALLRTMEGWPVR